MIRNDIALISYWSAARLMQGNNGCVVKEDIFCVCTDVCPWKRLLVFFCCCSDCLFDLWNVWLSEGNSGNKYFMLYEICASQLYCYTASIKKQGQGHLTVILLIHSPPSHTFCPFHSPYFDGILCFSSPVLWYPFKPAIWCVNEALMRQGPP